MYRVLATQLQRAGYAALRFDYSGTGDSLGESADATVDAWVSDIGAAAERLRSATGAARLAVVGFHFGATLAMLASARGVLRPRHLLAWNPIVHGAAYLRELAAQHDAYMRSELGADWHAPPRTRADGTPTEALGAPISDALATQLAAIDLAATPPLAEQFTVITTGAGAGIGALRPRLPAATRWIEMNESAAWNTDAALNSMTVPMDIVQAFVARIEETSP